MTRRTSAAPHRPILVFLLKCLVYWGLALWGVSRVPAIEEAGIRLTIGTLQGLLSLMHISVQRSENILFVGNANVEIVSDCSPHMPYLIFAAVVLAFPATWKQRLIGLVLGAVVIHVFNILRILTLIAVLVWRRNWFEFAHVYLWQTGTILVVFATFAVWLKTVAARPRPA
jgi:exosortase/archaeosortase family protein